MNVTILKTKEKGQTYKVQWAKH